MTVKIDHEKAARFRALFDGALLEADVEGLEYLLDEESTAEDMLKIVCLNINKLDELRKKNKPLFAQVSKLSLLLFLYADKVFEESII